MNIDTALAFLIYCVGISIVIAVLKDKLHLCGDEDE
jgi:hypothetical protein